MVRFATNGTTSSAMPMQAVDVQEYPDRRRSADPQVSTSCAAADESPALALSWTLFHVLDEESPLYGMTAEDSTPPTFSLVVVVSGYDVVAAQTVHREKATSTPRFVSSSLCDVLSRAEDGRVTIDYGSSTIRSEG